ncbi:hypothetical protein ACFL27_04430 [candidate division CSSED10-310 bacterium]|uniref:Glycosyltransferase RgtA/B/C/D-like domain-containing protein n=1 Tax=candidate division CSSED10-310 bacterium TaxID=2855610 RepID=A0ABV6YTD4_UNCC1
MRSNKFITLILLSMILTLPFSGKAFHIDENVNYKYGHYLKQHPFSPFRYALIYDGRLLTHLYCMTHTPCAGYLNAAILTLIPEAEERVFHIFYAVFLALLLLSFHNLANHFLRSQMRATIILLFTPAVLLTSHSIWPDLAALSLAMAGLAVLSTTGAKKQVFYYFLTTILLTLAWMMAYPMFLFTVISPWAGMIKDSQKRLIFFPAIISTGFLFLVSCSTFLQTGFPRFLLSYKGSLIISPDFLMNLISLLCILGGTTLFPLFLGPYIVKRIGLTYSMISIVCFLPLYLSLSPTGDELTRYFLLPLFLGCGLLIFWFMINSFQWSLFNRFITAEKKGQFYFNNRDQDLFIFVWFMIFILHNVFVVSFGAVRYALPLLPVIILVFCRSLEKFELLHHKRLLLQGTVFVLTLCLALLLALADFEFAQCYEDIFRKPSFRQFNKGIGTVYLVGKHGFQYYGEKNGYPMYVKNRVQLKTGDLLARPLYCGSPLRSLLPPEDLKRLVKIASIPCQGRLPLRLVQFEGNAGFYCSIVGILPYTISTAPLEEFEIYLVP